MNSQSVRQWLRFARLAILLTVALPIWPQAITFTTLAGKSNFGSDDGTGSEARFLSLRGVVFDGAGNLIVVDQGSQTIRSITPEGVVTTLAGFAGVASGATGVGSVARFVGPTAITRDGSGNYYVSNTIVHGIRKITPAGVVSQFAGSTIGTIGFADGVGPDARFNAPNGLATDSSGNLFVVDTNNATIRRITPDGVVTTFAGTHGLRGATDATGAAARFNFPAGIAIDQSTGTMYVADRLNSTIRKITSGAVVTTFAGLALSRGTVDGTGSDARFDFPKGVAIDSLGNVFVAESATIRKITPAAEVTTFAGSVGVFGHADGTGTASVFFDPQNIAIDGSNNLYVSDDITIRKITPGAEVTTTAGSPRPSDPFEDASGSEARFSALQGLALDSAGNIYSPDSINYRIRRITPAGDVTTFAGSGVLGSTNATGTAAQFNVARGIASDGADNLYVADTASSTIRMITPGAVVTTLAGTALSDGDVDGTGSAARFRRPEGVAVSADGTLIYVADTGNHTIRVITAAGEVTTLAGLAGTSGSTDAEGTAARFRFPAGIAVDTNGDVYVADTFNSTIRKITAGGTVTTFAGTAGGAGFFDGNLTTARFRSPKGVMIIGGVLYVADTGNHTIRKIEAGMVTTIGGFHDSRGSDDGTASAARFDSPGGVAVTGDGTLYVTDFAGATLRKGRPALADLAIATPSPGAVGAVTQLDTAPQTATSWTWRLVRRPYTSTATISNASINNPQFIPDVADTYVFRLTASNGTNTSITLVNVDALPSGGVPSAPSGLQATASSTALVALSWATSPGVDDFEVARASAGSPLAVIATVNNSFSFNDTTVTASNGYVYRVRALGPGGPSALGNADIANTFVYTDEPLVAGVTPSRAVHVTQLQTAINAVRGAAGLLDQSFPAVTTGTAIEAAHMTGLRTALSDALTLLGVPFIIVTDPTLGPGTTVRAAHVQEIRAALK